MDGSRMTATESSRALARRTPGAHRRALGVATVLVVGALLGLGVATAQSTRDVTAVDDGATIAPRTTGGSAAPPADLRDVNAWVAWKNLRPLGSLPAEARLFYRRGLLAHQSGQTPEAFADVRGAIDLDPSFIEPHLTLAAWSLFSDPAQTLVHLGAVVDLWRDDFNVQVGVSASVLVLLIEALFAGLLFAGLFVVLNRRHELAHTLIEELTRVISPSTARLWVSVLLLLPFLAGLGLTLPVLALLAYLLPSLRPRERVLAALLALAAVGSPFALTTLDRFALAMRLDQAPFYELPLIQQSAPEPTRQARLAAYAAKDPGNGFAQFALAWHSRRTGELELADRAYRDALTQWPENDAVLTNLGNVAAMRGRVDEALEYYTRAVRANPANAAAHFNASQLHIRRFEYTASNDELKLASAIDFELVKRYQARAGASGLLPLVDLWPAPRMFWSALGSARLAAGTQPLPLLLRGRIESAGLPFSLAALCALSLGAVLGQWQHRRLPLRACSNCGVIVCRRCAKRRREAALCRECDRIGAGAETQEFSRVLLLQHRGRRRGTAQLARTALAALVPGYGLLSQHRVFGPTILLACSWLLGRLALDFTVPFSVTPRLGLPGADVPPIVLLFGLGVVYAWSLGGYFLVVARDRDREARLEAASRGRITQATRRQSTLAA